MPFTLDSPIPHQFKQKLPQKSRNDSIKTCAIDQMATDDRSVIDSLLAYARSEIFAV